MIRLVVSAVLFVCICTGEETDSASETQNALEKLLENAGEMTIQQIHTEVQRILSRLEPSVRIQHELWRRKTLQQEKERQQKLRFAERSREHRNYSSENLFAAVKSFLICSLNMEQQQDVLFHLSVKAQQKLVRIIMIQENRNLTQNEKRRRLQEISKNMDPKILEELISHISEKDLYRMAF